MPAGRRSEGCEGGRSCTNGLCGQRGELTAACSVQAAELAEYTAKIALLEEARRRKEDEVEEWQHRVSGGRSPTPGGWGRARLARRIESLGDVSQRSADPGRRS